MIKPQMQSGILNISIRRNPMFARNDKKKLYWLSEQYLSRHIDERTFCDEFYYSFDLVLDKNSLSEDEIKLFSSVSDVASRYSEFEEDHKLNALAFSTTDELRSVVQKALTQLMQS
jgi:hypothetical protein